MASVTNRIKEISQPRGGYLNPRDMDIIQISDGQTLLMENINPGIVGTAVDYLTRFLNGTEKAESFKISLRGASNAGKSLVAESLLKRITGLDDDSIVSACKLSYFDVWFRNPAGAMMSQTDYRDINPDKSTINNIKIMVNRSINFFKKYGPIICDGFNFVPPGEERPRAGQRVFGGYTTVVNSGDGDFLTKDTLWDFKTISKEPTSAHTLQLLMYFVMGKHSGQQKFDSINNVGIFNPRLNKIYLFDITKLDKSIIKTIEDEVICY